MKRLLTGIQPTGKLHIGNYLGAIKNFLDLQDQYENFFMLADLHALTVEQNPQEFSQTTLDLAATLIACGIDPNKTTFFIQSAVPAHLELAWILSTLTPLGELERMTQYKDKSDKFSSNAGLLTYPVLMAADILLYQGELVPVGEDQVQHLELARILARKFNNKYGQTFVEPKPIITEAKRIMSLKDPSKKMSKSIVGSAIGLDDSETEIRKTIMSAVTDSTNENGQMSAGVANLFTILEEFNSNLAHQLKEDFNNNQLKYVDLKENLATTLVNELGKISQKKKGILANPNELINILQNGSQKANEIAQKALIDIKDKVGLINL
jgi:tryptophanyl-tRNA synthetase